MIYAYTRVSTIEQASGTSLDEQLNKAKGVALMRGAEIAEVFTDAGVSGSSALRQRPAGSRLLDAVNAGDVIIVAKLDRIFRSAADALTMVEELKGKGVDLIVTDIGIDPVTQNGASKMFFGMMACVAEFERSRIKERQAEGLRAKREKSGFTGGKRPFGYQVQGTGKDAALVEDPIEQEALATIRRLRAEGHGYQRISDQIQASGLKLSHMTVKRILARDAVEPDK
jgi:DNA invertase Pin-like site-specific DNA recombinase